MPDLFPSIVLALAFFCFGAVILEKTYDAVSKLSSVMYALATLMLANVAILLSFADGVHLAGALTSIALLFALFSFDIMHDARSARHRA